TPTHDQHLARTYTAALQFSPERLRIEVGGVLRWMDDIDGSTGAVAYRLGTAKADGGGGHGNRPGHRILQPARAGQLLEIETCGVAADEHDEIKLCGVRHLHGRQPGQKQRWPVVDLPAPHAKRT